MFLEVLLRTLMSYGPGNLQYMSPCVDSTSKAMILTAQFFSHEGYPLRLDFIFYRGREDWRI